VEVAAGCTPIPQSPSGSPLIAVSIDAIDDTSGAYDTSADVLAVDLFARGCIDRTSMDIAIENREQKSIKNVGTLNLLIDRLWALGYG
jgi:hypothetical protein